MLFQELGLLSLGSSAAPPMITEFIAWSPEFPHGEARSSLSSLRYGQILAYAKFLVVAALLNEICLDMMLIY
jgi:hypothetical protein